MQCPRTWRLFVTGLCLGLSACLSPVTATQADEDAAGSPDLSARFGKNPDSSGMDLSLTGPDLDEGSDSAVDDVPADAPDDVPLDAGDDASDAGDLADSADVAGPADVTAAADVSATGDAGDTSDIVEEVVDAGSDASLTAVCGDGTCAGTESCSACPSDCGACPCGVLGSSLCASVQQCYPNGDVTFCAKAGSLVHGATCKFYNDCVVGALCAAGQCRQLCDFTMKNASFSCKPGVPCEKLLLGKADPDGSVGVCKPGANCDALTDVGCGTNHCVPSGWLKTCVKPGTGGAGAACQATADCVLGTLCDGGACLAKCNTGAGDPVCTSGSCMAFPGPDGKPVPGQVGTCH